MQRLSLIIGLFLIVGFFTISSMIPSDSPHGDNFKYACIECHTTSGWVLDSNHTFNHASTSYQLEGQHGDLDCASCHKSLVFSDAEDMCSSCHNDVHNQTVGTECSRCHTSDIWLVSNVSDIHFMSSFPLVGAHAIADCAECHISESSLEFPPLSTQCYDCHAEKYNTASKPNHITSGFSVDCEECHNINAYEWNADGFHHNYFPLTGGHANQECSDCHANGNYTSANSDCFSCHEADYNSATNPNHLASNFTTDCALCHNTNPGWKPSTFDHNQYFPIYSGSHSGEWNSCTDCHTNTSNYASFSCIDCHEHNKADMDDEHDDENNYVYSSTACLNCHPRGEE